MWTLEFWVKQQHTAKLQALNFKENYYLVLSWALAWPSISYFDTLNHVMFLYFIHSSTELSKFFYHCQTFGLTQWKVLSDQTMFCPTRNMYYCKNIVNIKKKCIKEIILFVMSTISQISSASDYQSVQFILS